MNLLNAYPDHSSRSLRLGVAIAAGVVSLVAGVLKVRGVRAGQGNRA